MCLLAAGASAQVPDEHYLVSSYQYPSQQPGPGGLWVVHPRIPGPPTEITGLPTDLTGSGTADRLGANSVAIHPSDGRIFAGAQGPPGTAIALHEITLSGTAVDVDVAHPLGAVKVGPYSEGGVYQMTWLPDETLLVAVFELDGLLDDEHLFLFDPDPDSPSYGSITPVPIQNPPPEGLNALAVDAAGSTAYLGEWVGNQAGRIWALPIPSGGAAALCAQVSGGVTNLARSADGALFATASSSQQQLFEIVPGPCTSQWVPTATGPLNGIDVENATGFLAVVSSVSHSAYWMTPAGQETLLTDGPPGGWGRPSGIYVNQTREVGSPYCFCASGAPCGNADAGAGCANSSGAGGSLSVAGSNSAGADDLSLPATNLIPGQPALLFAGESAVNGGDGVAFGDGLRCAGMNVVRLGVETPDGAGSASWGPGLGATGGWSPGETRYFQGWYRDPTNTPCGSGFNLTNGVEVTFVP